MNQKIDKQIDYLINKTDKIGIIEHCVLDVPNYKEGYCVDDNARAIQVCLRLKNQYPNLKKLLPVYLNFLKSALKKDGLNNDLNFDLSWKENKTLGEHYGRTLAALGELIKIKPDESEFFDKIYAFFTEKRSLFPRVSAQIILGLQYYRTEDIKIWADLLVNKYLKEKSESWKWFESIISYDSGRLPMALLTAYKITNEEKYLQISLESLDFLTKNIFNKKENYFNFPGNDGWISANNKAIFDQQPIEAGSMVETYALAYKITNNLTYKGLASTAFDWYDGKNISKISLINSKNGGIYDGLTKEGVNFNCGAESVLSYLLAYEAIQSI